MEIKYNINKIENFFFKKSIDIQNNINNKKEKIDIIYNYGLNLNSYEKDFCDSIDRRLVSRTILKNKGLLRYRKKQISRVKLRRKYDKLQKIRLKNNKKSANNLNIY